MNSASSVILSRSSIVPLPSVILFSSSSRRLVPTRHGVLVTQTGCIGMCQYEPIVEVTMPGQEKVTYVKMTPDKARRVVAEHLIGGKPVTEYTIGAVR